jgi:asparagine synthase (glutamine-hydrolysing)
VLRVATADLLPAAVRRGGKRGFEIPLAAWLAGPWREEVRQVLEDPAAKVRSYVEPGGLAPWRDWEARKDRTRAARAVYTLLTLEHWLRRWAD